MLCRAILWWELPRRKGKVPESQDRNNFMPQKVELNRSHKGLSQVAQKQKMSVASRRRPWQAEGQRRAAQSPRAACRLRESTRVAYLWVVICAGLGLRVSVKQLLTFTPRSDPPTTNHWFTKYDLGKILACSVVDTLPWVSRWVYPSCLFKSPTQHRDRVTSSKIVKCEFLPFRTFLA